MFLRHFNFTVRSGRGDRGVDNGPSQPDNKAIFNMAVLLLTVAGIFYQLRRVTTDDKSPDCPFIRDTDRRNVGLCAE